MAEIDRSLPPRDLRDTYASQLLTAGVQVGYISAQLGHHDATVTTGAYAKWAEEGYRRRVELGEQEVPADLLAHLDHGDAWAHATG